MNSKQHNSIPYSDRVRVLVVDDSTVFRALLIKIFENDDRFIVIGVAPNGKKAIELSRKYTPDIITMDVMMPEMNGIEATYKILSEVNTRIVILSSLVENPDANISFEGLRAGALDVIQKPSDISDKHRFRMFTTEFLNHIYALSKVPIHRPIIERASSKADKHISILSTEHKPAKIIAIGASTGGPNALHQILISLSPNIEAPIVIAQHIGKGFVSQLADWLNAKTNFHIKIAEDGETLQNGIVYIAPDDKHITVDRPIIRIKDEPAENGYKPSVDKLFYSVANTYKEEAVGVLLTGMGSDGAKGLRHMFEQGAFTIAQDKQSSVVFGMPKAAIDAGAAMWVLNIHDIAHILERVCKRKNNDT